jgi:endoglucanase
VLKKYLMILLSVFFLKCHSGIPHERTTDDTTFQTESETALETDSSGPSLEADLSEQVKVNQQGYLLDTTKIAYVSSFDDIEARWFVVESKTDEIVFTGDSMSEAIYDETAEESVSRLDFSSLEQTGTYYISVSGIGRSFNFSIAPDIYNDVFRKVMRSYYYQRCGTALEEPFAEGFERGACHLDDGYQYGGYDDTVIRGPYIETTGGWHDAGDHGKKVTPAATSIFYLLKTAEYLQDRVFAAALNLPDESFEMPDILKEVKYELDLFFKMQTDQGAVYHLITSPDFFFSDSPDKDKQDRFLVTPSSVATADFAAVTALASKVYRSFNEEYADKCLAAAERAWDYLESHTDYFPVGGYVDPEGIQYTGQYLDDNDRDERLWAAAELFNATGREDCRSYFEENRSQWNPSVVNPPSWMQTAPFAMYTYLLAVENEQDNPIRQEIAGDLETYASNALSAMNRSGYGIPFLTSSSFYWGSNMVMLGYGADLIFAHLINPNPQYLDGALSILNYILGANALNLSFVTGVGTKRVMAPHQSAAPFDGIDEPPPGYVPGGPNYFPDPNDSELTRFKEQNNPPAAKCYVDSRWAYSCNEVSVNMMAPLVFLSSYFYRQPEAK